MCPIHRRLALQLVLLLAACSAGALARAADLYVICNSTVSVTAAAHLSPLVDYADLDGNLLIANDPFHGVRVEKGKLILPNRPGLGLTPA